MSTIFFALAVIHSFSVGYFRKLAKRFKEGSVGENFFHILGEVEIVFGFWAGLFLISASIKDGHQNVISYLDSLNFSEPIFVFVIMSVCSTKPILDLASFIIEKISLLIPIKRSLAFYCSTLIVGPLLGSFITEPAAMTVTALILLEKFYTKGISKKLMYATIGVLFVNISVGGTLTPFAAPPILMVAAKWGWKMNYMWTHFGAKAVVAVIFSTILVAYRFRQEIGELKLDFKYEHTHRSPYWVKALHLFFLAAIILSSHHMALFVGLFLFFMGVVRVTKEYQKKFDLREPLLVGFFLVGLIVFGGLQRWWLEPILSGLSSHWLYVGAAALTSIVDNAALTYLGSQVPNLSEISKFALVAGSVVGGGLTVIANAPNPAGYGILNYAFGENGIQPLRLLWAALPSTIIALICFWFL